MANSFTVFPNVLPGNVTIGGNLTVGGDQIQIGAGAPFVRIGRDSSTRGVLSWNSQLSSFTRDSGSVPANTLDFSVDAANPSFVRQNAVGSTQPQAFQGAIFTDYTAHSHTGTTTEDTIYSKLIPANTIGANGGLRVRIQTEAGAQGATATTYRARLGGTQLMNIDSDTTGFARIIEVTIRNANATNAQHVGAWRINFGNGAAAGATNTTAIDTTVDQTLTITVQNGATTDSQSFVMIEVDQINSFGPV